MATQTIAQINIPSILIVGGGASAQIGELARKLSFNRVLLVTDTYMQKLGYVGKVEKQLNEAGIASTIFAKVQPDPTAKNVEDGLKMLRSANCDSVIALGGGSPIDTGKAIAVMATNSGWIGDYMGYHKVPHPGLPFIAIPTTAGTGSEVTKVIVITDTERNVKMMCLDRAFLPSAAIVDYELTMSMPKELTAAVGLDSLTHGIEAFVSKKANPFTDVIALTAIRLIAKNIRTAYNEPDTRDAREAMMLGSMKGGIAFSNSSVCLVHGMSRPIGANFHVPHGLSNAMLLPTVTEFSAAAAPERYAIIAKEFGEDITGSSQTSAAQKTVDAVKQLNKDLHIPTPKEFGISRENYLQIVQDMAKAAIASGSPGNNPRQATEEEIIELYWKAYE